MTETPLPLDEHGLKAYLTGFDLFAEKPQEGMQYLNGAFRRFILTLQMVPQAPNGESRLLELGANPYFLTLLLKRFRNYDLTLANFFGEGHHVDGKGQQRVSNPIVHEQYDFAYEHFNTEKDTFPYQDNKFDLVLFCEILEHLALDPLRPLQEIHRVLKPGGYLLLTTPNVLACQNIFKLAVGRNIYDSYSSYGVYGRHNREYTPKEVSLLLKACGFEVVAFRIEDIYPHSRLIIRLLKRFRQQWRDNIFVLAYASGVPQASNQPSHERSLSGQ